MELESNIISSRPQELKILGMDLEISILLWGIWNKESPGIVRLYSRYMYSTFGNSWTRYSYRTVAA